jgi:hypothetical protein
MPVMNYLHTIQYGCAWVTGIAIPFRREVIHMYEMFIVVFSALSFLVALINLIIVLIDKIKRQPTAAMVWLLFYNLSFASCLNN